MEIGLYAQVLLPVIAGAVIGFVPTWVLERRRERYARKTKWDDALYAASIDLMAAARRSEHISDQIARGHDDRDRLSRLDEEQQKLRVAVEQVRMLGNVSVQVAAQMVLHHAYAYRVLVQKGSDPYPTSDGATPTVQLAAARLDYYRAVRSQLQIQDPDQLAAEPSHDHSPDSIG